MNMNVKQIFPLLFLLLLQQGIVAQSEKPVTFTSTYNDSKKAYDYQATNHDYCPYYIIFFRSNGNRHATTVYPGESFFFSGKVDNLVSSTSSSLSKYRGDINAKVNVNHEYALPVATGDSVRVRLSRGSLLFSLRHASDTVYACRDGVVCDEFNVPQPGQALTVYHKDGSFAQYRLLERLLVKPGEKVKTGMPVAIVSAKRNLEITFYFLDINKVENHDVSNKYTILNPFFHTQNHGKVRLEDQLIYIGEITDEMLTQDMSKKELKQLKKKK